MCHPPRRRPRAGAPVLRRLAALVLAGSVAAPLGAQRVDVAEATATPELAAGHFLRSVRAIRWDAAARLLDAETLEHFRWTVGMVSDVDTTGVVRAWLTAATDSAGFSTLDPERVFADAIGALIDDMPGLMHALYDRDDEVLGHVAEGSDTAHVVYRTTARISGAVPETAVMTLRRAPRGWQVVWSDELAVLETALRGVTRARRPPPG